VYKIQNPELINGHRPESVARQGWRRKRKKVFRIKQWWYN
jgi:hypothetical protein